MKEASNKEILIIGAGAMTRAIAHDLSGKSYHLSVVDRDRSALERLVDFLKYDHIRTHRADVSDPEACRGLFAGKDLVIGAAGYEYNYNLTGLAIDSGAAWIDLGGNNDVVGRQFTLDSAAESARVAVIPDCGLAPGMINVLANDATGRLDQVDELHFRVGGLPLKPEPPLFYGLVFSPDGLANEYFEPARIVTDGHVREVPSLSGWERVHFGPPFGVLEAFHTSGGSSTMVDTFAGRIKELDYKTLRYPGHLRRVKLLFDLGLFNKDEIELADGERVVPRNLFGSLLARAGWVKKDTVVVKAWAVGRRKEGRMRVDYRLIDEYDPATDLTAMARTTGFSASVVADMILNGTISAIGVLRQEVSVPADDYFAEMEKRGVRMDVTETRLQP